MDYEHPIKPVNEITLEDKILKKYEFWFVAKTPFQYDYAQEEYILWPYEEVSELEQMNEEAKVELVKIISEWHSIDYTITFNSPSNMSYPQKLHFHILKLQNFLQVFPK